MLVKREKWEKALDCLDRINQCEQVGRLSLSTKAVIRSLMVSWKTLRN
jgi:hypothetical protein